MINTCGRCSAFRRLSGLCFCPLVPAHLSVISFARPDRGFLLDAAPALGLVALTLKHCCLQKTVYYSSKVHSAARFAAVTSFLGSFCVSWEMTHEPRLLQPNSLRKPCYSGFQERMWGMRIPSKGHFHYMLKFGALRPSSVTFL